MKKEKLMMMAAALFALAGCDNEETGNWAGEIRLGSNLAVQQVDTRAATGIQNDAFAIGENLDVYINEDVQKGQTPSTTYPQPLVYTTGSGGALSTATQPYFPSSGNGVNIYAVYPKDVAETFTVQTDQSTDAAYKASDLMHGLPQSGNPVARTKDKVNIQFRHLLSKVTIKLVAGTGSPDLDGATVKLKSLKPSTTLTKADGSITEATGNATDITVMNSGMSGSAVVIPQTAASANFVEVTLKSGGTLLGKLDDGSTPQFKGGHEFKYDITVNLTGLNITGSIQPWTPNNTQQGNAEMQ